MRVQSILALDIGTNLGWARGGLAGPRASGVYTLPKSGDDLALYFRSFRGWMTKELQNEPANIVVYEAPILPKGMSIMSRRKLYGLCGFAETVASDMGAVCHEAYLQHIRKHFIGVPRAPQTIEKTDDRRDWIKRAVKNECRARGWTFKDDNEADALALYSYAASCFAPSLSVGGTPLFNERAA